MHTGILTRQKNSLDLLHYRIYNFSLIGKCNRVYVIEWDLGIKVLYLMGCMGFPAGCLAVNSIEVFS